MLTLEGRQGKTVLVEGPTVKLIKRGSLFASRREKTIPIRNISSVEVKEPGALFAGFIQFSIAGGVPRDSSFTLSGGACDALQDENSVVFADSSSYEMALEIKEYIESYTETPSSTEGSSVSAADEIVKLKSLMDQGIISPADFQAKKRQLLGV